MSPAASAVVLPAAAALLLLLLVVVAVPAVLPVSAAGPLLVVVALVPAAAVGGRVRIGGDVVVPRAAAARQLSVQVFGKAAVELIGLLRALELPHHVVHLRTEEKEIKCPVC